MSPLSPIRPEPLIGLLLLAGCGSKASWPAPPQPAGLEAMEPAARERIAEARAAVEANRDSASSWGELGMIYDAERLRSLALECFDVAARLEPREPRWPYRTAVALSRLGRGDEAAAALERCLALEDAYAPTHYRLGLCRLESGDLDRAEAAFHRATEVDPAYPGGWIGLARVHLQRDENVPAIEILERLSGELPGDATVRALLSSAYRQAGRATEFVAEDLLADGDVPVWDDPWELEARRFRRTPIMLNAGQALEAGRAEEALRLLEQARREGSAPEDTTMMEASALVALGRFDEARAVVEVRLEREPNDTRAMLLLARVLQERGERPAALELLQRITTLEPTFAGAWAARGGLELVLERPEDAVTSLRRALELGLEDLDLQGMLASALIDGARWSEACEVLEAMVRARPDQGDSWALLAFTRSRLGQLETAEEALRRARAAGTPGSSTLQRKAESSIERKRRALERRAGGTQDPESSD